MALSFSSEAGGTRDSMRMLHPSLAAYREARLFHRGLNVHVVVDDVGNKLRVRQRLIHSSHDAETDVLVPVFHEGGNDGVEGTFVAGKRIG